MDSVATLSTDTGMRIFAGVMSDEAIVRDVDVRIPGRYRFEVVKDVRRWRSEHPAGCVIELEGVTVGMEPTNFFVASSG